MFDMAILTSYSFIIVALGTFLLSMAAGAVGCVTVLKGEALIGDAIGHSAFPGIVLAFMVFMQRDPLVLMIGAVFSASLAYILIQIIGKKSKLDLDASLAVILSTFFGLGMVLKSYIQGNPEYSGASQAGLQNYIFGQAAYIMQDDVKLIFIVAIVSLLLLIGFYKEIKVFVFDETYAKTIGVNTKIISFVILIMTISLIATGLKLVGAILIASLLIIPAITALQWSDEFFKVLIISSLTGGISSFLGTYISTKYTGMSTGPSIIVIMSLIAFLSLVFGKKGLIANKRRRKNFYAKLK